MARPYRLQGEGFFYHITSRGDDRKKIYLSEYDYKKFLEYVKTAKEKYKFHLYAYCLMGNHYHLLLETTKPNLSKIMQYINTSYTTYYNIKRKKTGHLFQGRFKSILVDEDSYLLELTRYIHLNPVKARLISAPQKYKWSSFNGYLKRKGDGYVDKQEIAKYINLKPEGYRQFVIEGIKSDTNPLKNTYAGFILGTTKFIKEKLSVLKNEVETKDFSYKKTVFSDTSIEQILDIVSKKYKINPETLQKSRNKPYLAKKLAIYLAKRYTNLTNKEIGNIFTISSTAAIKAARSIEKLMVENREVEKEVEGIISVFSA